MCRMQLNFSCKRQLQNPKFLVVKLGCYKYEEHVVDTQRFPPCKTTLNRLYFWEEVEVKKKINVLVALGKMKPSTLEYACKVITQVKKDGN